MKKSTIAAVAAAAMFGFGAVGSAMADTEISGFADINYDAFKSDMDEGNFRAAGEVDLVQTHDGAAVRIDLDLVNVLNSSPGADLASGTGGLGVDVEQLNFMVPVNDMLSITAGIQNSPFGLEGQDATDINFAANGLLWNQVPSNIAGAVVGVMPAEGISVNVGYINSWKDLPAAGDKANDIVATISADLVEGVSATVGYLTDETETTGDMVDVNVTLDLVENLTLDAEFLSADPATASGSFDSGYGLGAAYDLGMILAAVRYEASSAEGTGADQTEYSLAATYSMSEACKVRADFTSHTVDATTATAGNSDDSLTIQLLHSF